jgi:serine/threonine-protein kinase
MQFIGKYNIIKKLGSGSFGFVYLAEDPQLQVKVAIKVFKIKDPTLLNQVTSETQDAETVIKQRFIEEARTLRKLTGNPNIVEMYDFDALADGTPYYVMPFIPRTLVDEIGKDVFSQGALRELSKEQYPRRIATAQAINYLKQLATALCAVHQHGLVHRDIKPDNILINENNQLQLSDFGIAKLPLSEHSQTGFGMGSKNYMSPEQQESAKHVQATSDIYSLGVIAYRMFTGQLPLGRFQDPIHFAPEITQALNDLIILAISQSVIERPTNGAQFLLALNHAINRQESKSLASAENTNSETVILTSQHAKQTKIELKPLENKITELLIKQGEVKTSDLNLLQTLADIANLNNIELKIFVDYVVRQKSINKTELQAFILWMNTVNKRFSIHQQFLSKHEIEMLIEAGLSTTNKTAKQLKALIDKKQQRPTISTQIRALWTYVTQRIKSKLLIFSLLILLILGYQQYQSQQKRIANDVQSWLQAQHNNTIASYLFYLFNNSQGNYLAEAEQALTELTQKKRRSTADLATIKQQINAVQQQLIKLGYQISQTGKLDQRTQHAIERFEKEESLLVTGHVDELLLKKLKQAYQKKDQRLWLDAQQKHTVSAYQEYKTTFSQGLHFMQATHAIELLAIEKDNNEKVRLQKQATLLQETIELAINNLLNQLVTLPSGHFNMGCAPQNICKQKELPQHRVSVDTFSIMATEVTFSLWDACVDSGHCTIKANDEGWGRNNRPVIGVSYNDIIEEFIPWLNNTTGKTFTLPSEAQWEYAARAESSSKYAWSNNIDCRQARYSQFSGVCGNERKTSIVKSFPPNAFALFDMHGNVWEWTQDCWNRNYNSAPKGSKPWLLGDCSSGVIRGGSWFNNSNFLRSATRLGYSRSARSNANGFRLVLTTRN